MKLTVQHAMDATLTLAAIICEERQMPQKGKYRVARMHAKLLPEFKTINERRDEMIKAYDYHVKVPGPMTAADPLGQEMVDGPEWQVPPDKNDEFNAAWKAIADDTIELEIQPIPLAYLDLGAGVDGSITANELIILGDLVSE